MKTLIIIALLAAPFIAQKVIDETMECHGYEHAHVHVMWHDPAEHNKCGGH